MKRTTLLTSTLLVATMALPFSVQAEGWQVLPVMKAGYKADAALAIVGGVMEANDDNKDIFSPMGVEVSINCFKEFSEFCRSGIAYSNYFVFHDCFIEICYNLGAIFSGEDGLKPQLKKSQYYLQKACALNYLKACTLLDEVENRLSGEQDDND